MDTSVIVQNPPVQITIQVMDSISCHDGIDGKLTALVTTGIAPFHMSGAQGTMWKLFQVGERKL